MICCYCHPKEASCKKREKVTEAFLRLALPLLRVDAAADDESAFETLRCHWHSGAKNEHFSYMGRGVHGEALNNHIVSILLPIYPLTHINLHV